MSPDSEFSTLILMLDSWNENIFNNIKHKLQDSAMKLVHSERNGEAFDSQLVIGVRESYVNLCSNSLDKLQIYRENFEKQNYSSGYKRRDMIHQRFVVRH
ncbi:Cullin-5 [Armadillidium vulgare]|nr:Cullin-5 [Armadillidium vulgare]